MPGLDLLNMDLPDAGVRPSETFDRNLQALAVHAPGLAARLDRATPRTDVEFFEADDGVGVVCEGRTLASKRRPTEEATRFAASIDPTQTSVACVLGFGAGHHVRAIADRLGRAGVVVCFEPDLGLLRAVLERIDHSPWLSKTRVVVCDRAEDRAPIADALRGLEGTIAMGVRVIAHPASTARLGASAGVFEGRFTEVIRATKTQVATTLIQAERTLGNLAGNAARYAGGAGIGELRGAAKGRGCVVVSAGPSLARNIELLEDPASRARVVVIAVQTTLRTLLARGIRPDFVVALDYHEISTRFYEGLTADDVRGVTFVVEPKVNPAVLAAWPAPGQVRFVASGTLDDLLGAEAGEPKGELTPGATVAHLAVYLARHLGCDPVVLIGQDLAFTDHRYYADGAAIHGVWAGELSEVRTLECLEWERIARGKSHLRQVRDHAGGIVFSDEQMASYLAQFEQDFAQHTAQGLTTINATEGGAAIAHTQTMTLAEALGRCPDQRPDGGASGSGAFAPVAGSKETDADNVADRVRTRLARVAHDARRVTQLSTQTRELLTKMLDAQAKGDGRKVNELIARVQEIGREVTTIAPAFGLAQFINQSGVLNRVRADRQIEVKPGSTEVERQRMQIERDIENVRSIGEAGERLATLLERATRSKTPSDNPSTSKKSAPTVRAGNSRSTLDAVVLADPGVGGLGTQRDLGRELWRGRNALQLTIDRLRRAGRVGGIILATPEPERVRSLLAGDEGSVSIERIDADEARAHARGVGRTRVLSPASWRGTPGGVTCFDEALPVRTIAGVYERLGLNAALILGADWCLVDPKLCDEAVRVWSEAPDNRRVVATNAAPGLAPAVVDREVLTKLAAASRAIGAGATDETDPGQLGGHLASLASVLSYVPAAPTTDPIGRDGCVLSDPEMRDCGVRAIADTSHAASRIARVLARVGDEATGAEIARALRRDALERPDDVPQRVTLEVNTGRLSRGVFASWKRGEQVARRGTGDEWIERRPLSFAEVHRVLAELAKSREDAVVTLDGVGDPGMHPGLCDLVRMCCELRIAAVHVRTELAGEQGSPTDLIEAGAALVSVDLHSAGAARDEGSGYEALMANGRFGVVEGRVRELVASAARCEAHAAWPTAWVLPRTTRCDATLAGLPDWYDFWTTLAGGALIDGVPAGAGERLREIPLPRAARERLGREVLTVRSDLSVRGLPGDGLASRSLAEVWREVCRRASEARESAA